MISVSRKFESICLLITEWKILFVTEPLSRGFRSCNCWVNSLEAAQWWRKELIVIASGGKRGEVVGADEEAAEEISNSRAEEDDVDDTGGKVG